VPNASALSPDCKTFAVALPLRTIQFIDAASGKKTGRIELPKGQLIAGLTLSADGKTLAGLQGFYDPLLWDATAGKLLRRCQTCTSPMSLPVLSNDGKFLTASQFLLTSGPERLPVWETATGKLIHELELLQTTELQAVFSPDGKQLATGGRGPAAVQVWDHAAGKELFRIETKVTALLRSMPRIGMFSDGEVVKEKS
jgi:WD40 repeat protein